MKQFIKVTSVFVDKNAVFTHSLVVEIPDNIEKNAEMLYAKAKVKNWYHEQMLKANNAYEYTRAKDMFDLGNRRTYCGPFTMDDWHKGVIKAS